MNKPSFFQIAGFEILQVPKGELQARWAVLIEKTGNLAFREASQLK